MVPPALNTYMNSRSFISASAPLLARICERHAPTSSGGSATFVADGEGASLHAVSAAITPDITTSLKVFRIIESAPRCRNIALKVSHHCPPRSCKSNLVNFLGCEHERVRRGPGSI